MKMLLTQAELDEYFLSIDHVVVSEHPNPVPGELRVVEFSYAVNQGYEDSDIWKRFPDKSGLFKKDGVKYSIIPIMVRNGH